MKGLGIIVCLLALAAGSRTGFARLGETPQAIEQRYGPPVSSGPLEGFTRCVYEKESFSITIFYQNGVSILESFARRGMDQSTARKLAVLVATHDIDAPSPEEEFRIRQAAGIKRTDEVFWVWTTASGEREAAYNPLDCTLAFFGPPATYAAIHQAMVANPPPATPLAGS